MALATEEVVHGLLLFDSKTALQPSPPNGQPTWASRNGTGYMYHNINILAVQHFPSKISIMLTCCLRPAEDSVHAGGDLALKS